MGIPYSKAYRFEGVVSGQDNCLEIPAPPRAQLNRLIVTQVTGTLDGFDFDLYDRHDACPGVSQDSCNPGDEPFDSIVHKIMATQTVAPASTTSEQYDLDLGYENKDSLCDGLRANKVDRLYLRIDPGGSGDKEFQVAITCDVDIV